MAPVSDTHASRIRRLRQLMRRRECTHLLISDTIDCRYASGFASSNVSLLLGPHVARLCTDFRYEAAAHAFCRHHRPWHLCLVTESDLSFLHDLVPAGSVLGIQSNALTLEQFAGLERALPDVRFVRVPELSDVVSTVKSPGERRLIARCARMADTALHRTLPHLRTGVSEKRVRDVLEEECRKQGSEGPAFDTIVLFGRRTALPHGTPSSCRLRSGDFVLFDFGCSLQGMRSDMTRTVVKGRASARQRDVYGTVLHAQQRACRAVAPNVAAREIDRLAREEITAAGYGKEFGHATGHGVGYRIHEAPRLASRSTSRLAEYSVVTVEPGIYIRSFGGVRIEDIVVPVGSGRRVLSRFPRNLMEV